MLIFMLAPMLWRNPCIGKIWNPDCIVDSKMKATLIIDDIPVDCTKNFNGKTICSAFCNIFYFEHCTFVK